MIVSHLIIKIVVLMKDNYIFFENVKCFVSDWDIVIAVAQAVTVV